MIKIKKATVADTALKEKDNSCSFDLNETLDFLSQGIFLYSHSLVTIGVIETLWSFEDFYEKTFEISDLKRQPPLGYIDALLKAHKILQGTLKDSEGIIVGGIYFKKLLLEDYLKYCLFTISLYFYIKKKNSKLLIPLGKQDRAVFILATQIYTKVNSEEGKDRSQSLILENLKVNLSSLRVEHLEYIFMISDDLYQNHKGILRDLNTVLPSYKNNIIGSDEQLKNYFLNLKNGRF